ncbi:MAG: integrase arm-type DNA-binding domain-containing protein [Nitrosospira sp.]
MRRRMLRLTAREVVNKKKQGNYCDGGGLYLQISEPGSKSWIFRFALNGKDRHMGLGSCHTVSLAEARGAAVECRKLVLRKIDPIASRDADHAQQRLEAAKSVSFSECANAYIKTHRSSWKNAKHADQWANTIKTYCGPVMGGLSVQTIDTALIMRVLEPIWTVKPETASRLRGRIESVLDWAVVSGYREGDNPARWRGHLDNLLPSLKKKSRVKHHPALPFEEMSGFMEELKAQEGVAARALEFLILTAARTGETIGAQWKEFDLTAMIWTIPAVRMKASMEHRIPLSKRAMEIVRALHMVKQSDFVFPGQKEGKPLTTMAMLALLKRMEKMNLTVHGFRSSFRDWASECTNFPRDVCEMALSHTIANQAEAAYRRGDLIDKRRSLMEEWSRHCYRLCNYTK